MFMHMFLHRTTLARCPFSSFEEASGRVGSFILYLAFCFCRPTVQLLLSIHHGVPHFPIGPVVVKQFCARRARWRRISGLCRTKSAELTKLRSEKQQGSTPYLPTFQSLSCLKPTLTQGRNKRVILGTVQAGQRHSITKLLHSCTLPPLLHQSSNCWTHSQENVS